MHVDFSKFYDAMNKYYGITDDEIADFIDSIQGLQNLGIMSIRKFLELKFPDTDFYEPDPTHLENAWNSAIYPCDTMLGFISDLRSSNVKIALLSNIGPEHANHLRKTYPYLVQDCIEHFSCEVGAMKPNKLFYQSFLLDHKEFSGCVYLDDRPENVIAGNDYKFNAINFDLYTYSQCCNCKNINKNLENKLKDIKTKIL